MIYKFDDFVSRLKHPVDYDKETNKHWLGINLLTNDDMHKMCLNFFQKDYELLTNSEQRKVREEIFRQLRGNSDGKTD